MHDIHVSVVSSGEAADGIAEFWFEGRLVAFTHLEDGDLMLRFEPQPDGAPLVLGAHGLAKALAEANDLIAAY